MTTPSRPPIPNRKVPLHSQQHDHMLSNPQSDSPNGTFLEISQSDDLESPSGKSEKSNRKKDHSGYAKESGKN